MKLSKFVKRAKSESYCVVIHADDSGIWLGTRLALYNATELPYMEGKEQAGAVLDIDSKAWEKMFFDEKYTAHAGADFGMNLTETDPTEQEARRVPLEMFYKGMGLVGLMYGNGGELIFYDAALIAPIADVVKTSDYIQTVVRKTAGGAPYVVIKDGFEVLAGFAPLKIITKQFLEDYREQKHICGKNYATAPYMEVDLYPVTPKQHNASRRAKRKEAGTLAQQTYNDNRAKRYHVQLVNANFGKGDFSWTGTYDDDHHPEPGDTAKADRDLTNYIKRLYRWCDKNGVQRPKWVAATEYCTVQEDGTACGRHHHHAIIQHTDGLTRDVLEQLWADKAGQIGFTRCEYLDVDHGSVESLVRYISKNKRCARSWRQSRGLEKPKTPPPNDTKWSRKKLDEASTLYIDDVAYWERKYPGYTLNRVETRVSNAGWRHTTVIMRRAECWHGTPGRKVTPRMNR